MTNQHPITPPLELVEQWRRSGPADAAANNVYELHIARQAAQWGADQELEACVEWLDKGLMTPYVAIRLREDRRPKPPSLAEQATAELDDAVMRGDCITTTDAMPLLRAAIKRLAELDTNSHYLP